MGLPRPKSMAPPKFADIEKKANDVLTKDLKPSYGLKIKRTCEAPVGAAFTSESSIVEDKKAKGSFTVGGKLTVEKYKVAQVKGLTIDKVILAEGAKEPSLGRPKPLDTTLDLSYVPEGMKGVKLIMKNKMPQLVTPMAGYSVGLGLEYATDGLLSNATMNLAKKVKTLTDDAKEPLKDKNGVVMKEEDKAYTPSFDLSISGVPTKDIVTGLELKKLNLASKTASLTAKASVTSGAAFAAVVFGNDLTKGFGWGDKPTISALGAFKYTDTVTFGAKFARASPKAQNIAGSVQYTASKQSTMRVAADYGLVDSSIKLQAGISQTLVKGTTLLATCSTGADLQPTFGLQLNLEA